MKLSELFEPPTAPTGTRGPAPVLSATQATAYGLAALQAETDAVAMATAGTRNDALNRAAFNLHQLVLEGHLVAGEVEDALYQAATACGLPAHEIRATLGSATRGATGKRRLNVPEPTDGPAPDVQVVDAATILGSDGQPVADPPGAGQPVAPFRFQTGGGFILDTPANPRPIWGRGQEVLWAEGEALMIASLQGLGKSTLAQQLALGRCGFPEYAETLGFPVLPGERRTLYLAMDRPRQIARSFRRMVGEAWRSELDDRLSVWTGPPPRDLAKHPGLLTQMCQDADADTVAVDSLKDAAIGLNDDEVGAMWNRALQYALEAGVNVIEAHHNRKAPNGGRSARVGIDDVYGSTWLTSGVGSVIMLTGAPGDPVVDFHQVKQPADEVGPFKVLHDHDAGRSTIWQSVDLLALVKASGSITAKDAAAKLYDVAKPTAADVAKARRKLEKLTRDGHVQVVVVGDDSTSTPTRWGSK